MRQKLIALSLATSATVAGLYWGDPGHGVSTQQQIATYEGKVNKAYPDVAHGWAVTTICHGHTKTARRGQWLSDKECLDLLDRDIDQALAGLRRLVGTHATLTPGELAGTVSFVFNIGDPKLQGSTWQRKFNAGDRVGACKEMLRWVYANKKKLPGLETRRRGESAVCLRDLQR